MSRFSEKGYHVGLSQYGDQVFMILLFAQGYLGSLQCITGMILTSLMAYLGKFLAGSESEKQTDEIVLWHEQNPHKGAAKLFFADR